MGTPPPPPLLVVADTNVPLDLARGREAVVDALGAIRVRLRGGSILIPPTVVRELAYLADEADEATIRDAAGAFLRRHGEWGCRLINHVALGDAFIEQVAERLRTRRLLPASEVNDSLILVEAAALQASLLLTSDEHLRGMDWGCLKLELDQFDLAAPVIATPTEIVRKFLH